SPRAPRPGRSPLRDVRNRLPAGRVRSSRRRFYGSSDGATGAPPAPGPGVAAHGPPTGGLEPDERHARLPHRHHRISVPELPSALGRRGAVDPGREDLVRLPVDPEDGAWIGRQTPHPGEERGRIPDTVEWSVRRSDLLRVGDTVV